MFIDAFAGPGEYVGAEPGSPLVALEAASLHQERLAHRELVFSFIEQDSARYEHLDSLISDMQAAGEIPDNVHCEVVHGSFEDVVRSGLDSLGHIRLAPAFVMVDPFGPKGIPYDLIKRLAGYRQTELLISFMYESMARFLSTDEFAPHLDALFGCTDWRAALEISEPEQKRAYLHDLFKRQLEVAGMEHVRSFEMIDDGGRTEYFLFFATHHVKGLEVMKDAMWSIDPSGGYRFSDATDPNQPVLFEPEPDFGRLQSAILGRFEGLTVGIRAIEDFVIADTPFRKAHIRKNVLQSMEDEGLIQVTGRSKRRTYPVGCSIRFV